MDERAPTHPIGAMLGERGWTAVRSIVVVAGTAAIAFVALRVARMELARVERGSIVRLLGQNAVLEGTIVLAVTGVVAAVLLGLEGHRPRVRVDDRDALFVAVGGLAVVVLAGSTLGQAAIAATQYSTTGVWGRFRPIGAVMPLLGSLTVTLGICARAVGEELLVRSVVQRRCRAVFGPSPAIAITVALHVVFVFVIGEGYQISPWTIVSLGFLIFVSAIAGLAYDRTDSIGPPIVVRLVASAFVAVIPTVIIAVSAL